MVGVFGLLLLFLSVCPWLSENGKSKQGFPVALWTNKLRLYKRTLYKRLLCLEASGSLDVNEVVEGKKTGLFETDPVTACSPCTLYIIAQDYFGNRSIGVNTRNYLKCIFIPALHPKKHLVLCCITSPSPAPKCDVFLCRSTGSLDVQIKPC